MTGNTFSRAASRPARIESRIESGAMPELPEVETVARGLRAVLPGRRILSVRLGKTDFIEDPAAVERLLPGLQIAGVRRHGKFLLVDFEPSNGIATGLAADDSSGDDGEARDAPSGRAAWRRTRTCSSRSMMGASCATRTSGDSGRFGIIGGDERAKFLGKTGTRSARSDRR